MFYYVFPDSYGQLTKNHNFRVSATNRRQLFIWIELTELFGDLPYSSMKERKWLIFATDSFFSAYKSARGFAENKQNNLFPIGKCSVFITFWAVTVLNLSEVGAGLN